MSDVDDCTDEVICQQCQYWEDRADINTENEIKMKVKRVEEDKIIAIPKLHTNNKPISGTHKADRSWDVGRKQGIIKAIIRKSRGWLNLPQ
tara:strand:- start:31 stop:303 length:273 start_codon:yes stop_codon:yes gene_type:complete